jgi:hypothetical protein
VTAFASEFATHRYVVWPGLLDARTTNQLYRYVMLRARAGTMRLDDSQVPLTPSASGDFVTDGVLADVAPRLDAATGIAVVPTYSFFRVYKRGDVLARHVDRPSCEISLTVCLGFVAPAPWPIAVEGPAGVSRVALQPGDALLYHGCECPHWRDAFDGDSNAQLFLHYVDRHGPHASWALDKRPALASLR